MNKYTLSKTPQVKVIACASLLALLLLVSIGCGKGTDAKQDGAGTAEIAVPVKVVVAGQGQSGGQMLATGTLEPVNQTQIGCKVGGIVAAVHVEVGDRVKKGQPLVTLQLTDYQLGVQQATAAYQSAQVNFETAEKNYQRVTNLKNDGSISAADFDQATLGYKAAKYGLEQAE
ncbi:MAG: biotin/lipoyl-binding protein, partial [Myxococcales bacterium]|nr:biotin/lipoyl-binding protein [Myxococcales bacterium]